MIDNQDLVAKQLMRVSFDEIHHLFIEYGNLSNPRYSWTWLLSMPETAAFFSDRGWDLKEYMSECKLSVMTNPADYVMKIVASSGKFYGI